MNRHYLTLAAAVSCAVCLYLIGEEAEQRLAVVREVAIEKSIREQQELPTPAATTKKPIEDQQTTDEKIADVEPVQVAFEPPFPDRTTLFQAPKRQGGGRAKLGGKTETAVELLGFVNVDEQCVALSIDGLVTTIAEGETESGIEVISIQPPAVVLQRGRQRWQASFGN